MTEYRKELDLYRAMLRIRAFEDRALQLYNADEVRGAVHSSAGQEAVAVGIGASIEERDFLAATHRGHGHAIAKGAPLSALMAELMGREEGACRGRGGSMHVTDLSKGLLGANGIVGATVELATGAALAAQVSGTDRVAVAVFGDGAVAAGSFHEALNLASLWKLPVLFVCENNGFGVSMRVENAISAERISDFAAAYRVPGKTVDGMVLEEVIAACRDAVERARNGEGPTLIEALTYRFQGHSRGDPPFGPYRTRDELNTWRERDPISTYAVRQGIAADICERIRSEVESEVEAAVAYARNCGFPSVSTLRDFVYAEGA